MDSKPVIHGWNYFNDFYRSRIQEIPDNGIIIEVGCWLGASSVFIAEEIRKSGKNIKLHCVDTWNGGAHHEFYAQHHALDDSLFNEFMHNIAPYSDIITVVRSDSAAAAAHYANESLHLVFVDAGHSREDRVRDINAWGPKVAIGRYFAGNTVGLYPTDIDEQVTIEGPQSPLWFCQITHTFKSIV